MQPLTFLILLGLMFSYGNYTHGEISIIEQQGICCISLRLPALDKHNSYIQLLQRLINRLEREEKRFVNKLKIIYSFTICTNNKIKHL